MEALLIQHDSSHACNSAHTGRYIKKCGPAWIVPVSSCHISSAAVSEVVAERKPTETPPGMKQPPNPRRFKCRQHRHRQPTRHRRPSRETRE
eukprot:6180725-Pleurochrysis_carterae.AAC.1